jgi:hypothetical protein
MKRGAALLVIAVVVSIGAPSFVRRAPATPGEATRALLADPDGTSPVDARLQGDLAAMEKFRPGYEFWRNIYTIADGAIAFGSAADGRLLAVFPIGGDWTRSAKWYDASLRATLAGRTLPKNLDDRRDYVASLLSAVAGPVVHNATRGGFLAPGARRYGAFLGEWGAIYERFGVPAEIGLAQAIVESGFEGVRRSEANAVGLCQWLESNWRQLDRTADAVIESGNQTTQAAYCAAYVSILATKYGSFIPSLSAHHAGGTNVGRVLVTGARLGGTDARAQYFLGSDLARDLRTIGEEYKDIYQSYGPRSYRYAEIVFGNALTVRDIVASTRQTRIYAMATNRAIALAEVMMRTGLTADEVRRYNPALNRRVPAGATLYLPKFVSAFGRDVTFWHRDPSPQYAAVLDEFLRLDAAPDAWDQRAFEPTLRSFERRFRATGTEEGKVMATVLAYVRQESMTSPRRDILAAFETSADIAELFERGVFERDASASPAVPAE